MRAATARSHGVLPDPSDQRAAAAYMLDLLAPPLDIDVVSALREWIAQRWPPGG